MKEIIHTTQAPAAIGTYSQAVRVANHLYISGQIPLNPATMQMVENDIDAEIRQVFDNLSAILTAAGTNFSAIVKLTIYVIDLHHFPRINEIMASYFSEPYPARAVIGVAALPKGARVEMDAVAVLKD
jgi:reactive intermediate/imine deaminase